MPVDLVGKALAKLVEHYVFPEEAIAGADVISLRDYSGLDESDLCARLTDDLFEIFADRHLRVRVRAAQLQDGGQSEEAAKAAWHEFLRATNYGIAGHSWKWTIAQAAPPPTTKTKTKKPATRAVADRAGGTPRAPSPWDFPTTPGM